MDKIKKLNEEIHILDAFHLILKKFGMDEEAKYVYDRVVDKEKELDTILDKKLYRIEKVKFKFYEDKNYKYFVYNGLTERYMVTDKFNREFMRMYFTSPEIAEIKYKQKTDLSDFEIFSID